MLQCTVVSFYPLDIKNETKPGLYPGDFTIPKSDGYEPEILHIGNSTGYVYLDDTRGSLRTTTPADEMARSIVDDFCNSFVYSEPGARPGLFWVEGALSVSEVMKKYKEQCEEARASQKRFFINLVKVADDEYNRTKQLKSVSDLQRFACNFLNLKREWNVEASVESLDRCPACASVITKGVAICPACTAILDKQKAAEFEFAGKK